MQRMFNLARKQGNANLSQNPLLPFTHRLIKVKLWRHSETSTFLHCWQKQKSLPPLSKISDPGTPGRWNSSSGNLSCSYPHHRSLQKGTCEGFHSMLIKDQEQLHVHQEGNDFSSMGELHCTHPRTNRIGYKNAWHGALCVPTGNHSKTCCSVNQSRTLNYMLSHRPTHVHPALTTIATELGLPPDGQSASTEEGQAPWGPCVSPGHRRGSHVKA